MTIELVPVAPCFLCGSESDMSVNIEGEIRGLCSDCWEKADPQEGDTDG